MMVKVDKDKISTSYQLAVGDTASQLECAVNELIAEGYLPCGNLTLYKYGQLIQPMIKTDIEEMEITK